MPNLSWGGLDVKLKHFIDSHKGVTAFFILGLMWCFHAWENTTAWVYLALHGAYGFLWVAKSRTFGDRQWEKPTTLWFGLYAWAGLSLYWIAPWLIISRSLTAPPWYIGLCVFIYAVGLFLHFAADMQKHTALALQPGLITTGLWSRTRNPNYLGELLIYLGFGLLAMHWLPLLVLAFYVGAVWLPNMLRKDRSLSRYPGFEAYRKRTGMLFPFQFKS